MQTKAHAFASMDMKDIFLHTVMKKTEYIKVQYKYFPDDIRKLYHLDKLVHSNDYVYVKIQKGMYGLKQAAILAYTQVSTLLKNQATSQSYVLFVCRNITHSKHSSASVSMISE